MTDYFGLTRQEFDELDLSVLKANFAPYERWQLDTANAERFTIPDGALFANQAELYRRISSVFTAIDIVASASALTEFSVARIIQGKEPKDIPGHDFEMLLSHPNPLDSRYEFLYATIAFWMLNKNAYWWLNRPDENTPPSELWFIPPHMIQPIPDGKMFLRGYLYQPGNAQAELFLPPHEIVHFKGFNPFSRFVGLSAGIESLMMLAQSYLGMTEWNAKIYKKSNGRLPSVMAFEQMIADPQWKDIKQNTREAAQNREIMMLRGVGQGGLQWIQNAGSQKDMDFYAGLDKIDKRIMDTLAPGAYTMLFENANEANSRTGRATLNELAVYPKHVVMSEKITNEILPSYAGRPLVGHFKDIRVTDRQLEITEQQEYNKTHTIAEIREEFYGDDPLGDERDDMLPVELEKVKATPADVNQLQSNGKTGIQSSIPLQEMRAAQNNSLKAGNDTSAMIALRIPDPIREELKQKYSFIDAETLDNLHITLIYLGDNRTMDIAGVFDAINWLAMYQSPIRGELQGVARFVSGTGTDPVVSTFDSPQMPQLFEVITSALNNRNIPYHRDHGFIPHMTLAYIPANKKLPIQTIEPIEITFNEVYFVNGDQWTPITLSGSANKSGSNTNNIILENIARYERFAIRKLKEKKLSDKFLNDFIPAETSQAIHTNLQRCTNEAAVKSVFEDARKELAAPKPETKPEPSNSEIMTLASALNNMTAQMKAQEQWSFVLDAVKAMGERTNQTPTAIYMPAPVVNLPAGEQHLHIEPPTTTPAPNYITFEAKPSDVHIASPINVSVESPLPPVVNAPIEIHQTIEAAEAMKLDPVFNFSAQMPEMPPASVVFAPVIQPSDVVNQNNITVEPTPVNIENNTTVQPAEVILPPEPPEKKKKVKIERDAGGKITGAEEV